MKNFDRGERVVVGATFYEKEEICERLFNESGPFWHLCTPGELCANIFTCEEDFRVGMNLLGVCADRFRVVSGNGCQGVDIVGSFNQGVSIVGGRGVVRSMGVKIYTFILMNNHIHIILCGDERACREFFEMFRKRLNMYFTRSASRVDLSGFEAELYPITSLKQLRSEFAYVNRNASVVNSAYTPYSYPWGAGYLFFNRIYDRYKLKPFSKLSVITKRDICKSRSIELSEDILVLENLIVPSCFCYIREAESFYRDAAHYSSLVSKNYEAFSEVAKRLGESVVFSDEEMYSAVGSICFNKYHIKRPSLLAPDAKLEVAKIMHFDYRASNKQIVRILKLDAKVVDELFSMVCK